MADELVRTASPVIASRTLPAIATTRTSAPSATSPVAVFATASNRPSSNAALGVKSMQADGGAGRERQTAEGADWEEEEHLDNVFYLALK